MTPGRHTQRRKWQKVIVINEFSDAFHRRTDVIYWHIQISIEDGLSQDKEPKLHHLLIGGNKLACVSQSFPALALVQCRLDHDCAKGGKMLLMKSWLDQAALRSPLLAITCEEPISH